jgi:hypothetical protein
MVLSTLKKDGWRRMRQSLPRITSGPSGVSCYMAGRRIGVEGSRSGGPSCVSAMAVQQLVWSARILRPPPGAELRPAITPQGGRGLSQRRYSAALSAIAAWGDSLVSVE